MPRFLLLLAALLTAPGPPAGAQFARGQVTDASGAGVPGASVALWRGTVEFLHVTTDDHGGYSFPADSVRQASALAVRAIGFTPRAIALASPALPPVIVLERPAQSLPALVASAQGRACPNHEEPAARSLWQAVRTRYQQVPLDQGYLSQQRWLRADVSAAEIRSVDPAQAPPGWEGVRGDYRLAADRAVQQTGYARRLTEAEQGSNPSYGAWWYPRLDRWDIDHWIREGFGALNQFSVGSPEGSNQIIVFCGRRTKTARIEGEMAVNADGLLTRIRWRFVTPRPDEAAGGEVLLVPTTPRLLPLRSTFYRRLAGRPDLFVVDAALHTGWQFGPTIEIPPRPPGSR